MELRRRPSGSTTPRKMAPMETRPSATRHSNRQVSMNGSNNGSASSSSRRNSINERSSVSPRDHYDSGERATKRRRISLGGKSNASQSSSDYQPPGPNLRRNTGYRQPAARDPPASRRKPKKARRVSSASDVTFDGHSSDNVILDNIVVALSPTPVSSPELPATGRSRLPVSPSPQPSVGAPAKSRPTSANGSKSTLVSPATALQTQSDSGSSSLAYGKSDPVVKFAESTPQRGRNPRKSKGDNLSHMVARGPEQENLEESLKTTSESIQNLKNPSVDVEGISSGWLLGTSAPKTIGNKENANADVSEETKPDITASAFPTESLSGNNSHLRHEDDVDSSVGPLSGDSASNQNPESKSSSQNGTIEGLNIAERADEDDEDDDDGASFAASNLDEDAAADAGQLEQDEDEDDDGEEIEDDDEMVDVDEDQVSDQSKQHDDAGSAAVSDIDDDGATEADLAVPKLVMTTASPSRPGSEDNNAPPSPTSMAADEMATTGTGKPVRRLPGRRRAPHPNPKVEADLRRQLDLRVTYRAVAKQLKPLLAELAKRNLADLKSNPEAHAKVSEHEKVKASLEERREQRLNNIKLEKQYNLEKMALLLEAEQDSQRMRYRQAVRNAQADFLNKLKHDFLMAIRRQETYQDEHASEDEEHDVVPSLYHVNVHGRRTHLLDRRHDSRSRSILETERLFNDLTEREYSIARDMQSVPDQIELDPRPFTFLDPTQREAVQHDTNLAALIQAMTRVSQEEVETPVKPTVPIRTVTSIPNDQAISLQILADASATAPGPIPTYLPSLASMTAPGTMPETRTTIPKATAKPTMASLLNADDPPVRTDRNLVVQDTPPDYQNRGIVDAPQPIAPQQQSHPLPGNYAGSPVVTSRASLPPHEQTRLPGFADQFENAIRSPGQRRHEFPSFSGPPQPFQPGPARELYNPTNGIDRHRDAMSSAVNSSLRSPHVQQSATIQPMLTSQYTPGSPERRPRRASQESFGKVRLAPKGQPGVLSPEKQPVVPVQNRGTTDVLFDKDHGQFRQPEQRVPPPFNSYPQSSSPAEYGDVRGRNRSISESTNPDRDQRRQLPEAGRLPPITDTSYGSYVRDRPYDPFRRSTISTADDSSRHYSPPQTNLPPHLHRSTTAGSSPLLSSHSAAPSPPDRYGRFPRESTSHRNRQPLQLPPALPPFNAPPRPIGTQQTPLPPMPTGLPPPPLPPLQSHLGQGAYGQSALQPFSSQPPSTAQPSQYSSGTSYGRQSLPPLSGPPHFHANGVTRELQLGPPPPPVGQPGSGYPPYPPAHPVQEERNGRSRTSSVSRQDRFQYYSGGHPERR
ncbi:hypothetical protein K461DRAFT_90554 [Myriangium duriaei CBS 260.36]|uniref:Uncharacterized protein n=1 Tax=Myriangium duriaei CBS 260.36 TaxID=1168546 RepID=A0A9P4J7G8_9PEZI|nr:hypothetical protein K461DRAFT_90554 [Myriangium duriaei CBS 260.36]